MIIRLLRTTVVASLVAAAGCGVPAAQTEAVNAYKAALGEYVRIFVSLNDELDKVVDLESARKARGEIEYLARRAREARLKVDTFAPPPVGPETDSEVAAFLATFQDSHSRFVATSMRLGLLPELKAVLGETYETLGTIFEDGVPAVGP
jgi:hypothetical protein